MAVAYVAWNFATVAMYALSTMAEIVNAVGTKATFVAVGAVHVLTGRTASSALTLPVVFVSWWKWLDNEFRFAHFDCLAFWTALVQSSSIFFSSKFHSRSALRRSW